MIWGRDPSGSRPVACLILDRSGKGTHQSARRPTYYPLLGRRASLCPHPVPCCGTSPAPGTGRIARTARGKNPNPMASRPARRRARRPVVCGRARRFQRPSRRWPGARLTPGSHGPCAPGIATTPRPPRVEARGNRTVSPHRKRGAARPRPLLPSRPPSKHTATAEKIPHLGYACGPISASRYPPRSRGRVLNLPSQGGRPGSLRLRVPALSQA